METTSSSSYNISTTAAPPGNDFLYYNKYTDLKKSMSYMSLIVCSLAFVLGVLRNGVVICVTGFLMKKTMTRVWFLNLAVADFIFTACLPLTVTDMALDFHRPFGKFMCRLNITLLYLTFFASVYILVVISADRCVSVVWPFWSRDHRNVRKASWVSLGVWVVSLILSIPYFIFRDTKTFPREGVTVCFYNFALSDDYDTPSVVQLRQFRREVLAVVRFLLGFVIPFTIIVSCNAVIIHCLRRGRNRTGQYSRPIKIIGAIITFFLCCAPFHIMGFVDRVKFSDEQSDTLEYIITVTIPIITSLPFLNSCLNPLLWVQAAEPTEEDKVRKSILKALKSAFQEKEEARSTHDMKTGESIDRLAADDTGE